MIRDKFSLEGKVAIVTGASRGLGQAIAIGLAEAGADIVGVARSDQSKTKEEVEKLGRKYLEIRMSVSEFEKLPEIIEKAVKEFGHVDILVNNAGIIRRAEFIEYPEEYWDEVMDVNIKALFLLTKHFAKWLVDNKRKGKIINIASMLSFQGGIFTTAYTVSKHGVAGLTKVAANELAKYGINVNAIAPGYMATDNTKPLREDPKRNSEIVSRIPMGRWGEPSDLKGAAVFLASEASDYVTGIILPVDGGWLSR